MGDAQGWPACPSEDPKDVPPEPENTPPGDAQGWTTCPGEEPKDVPVEPLIIPPGDARVGPGAREKFMLRTSQLFKEILLISDKIVLNSHQSI